MHNVISYNQLAGWIAFENRQDDIINDYYNCIIECDDDQHVCKQICKELLINL